MYESLEIKKEELATKVRISKSSIKSKKINETGFRPKGAASKKKLRYEINEFFPI